MSFNRIPECYDRFIVREVCHHPTQTLMFRSRCAPFQVPTGGQYFIAFIKPQQQRAQSRANPTAGTHNHRPDRTGKAKIRGQNRFR